MKKLVRPISVLVVIAIVLFLAGVVLPYLIEYFFKALLWFMQNPGLGLAITLAFIAGILFSEVADRADKKLSK